MTNQDILLVRWTIPNLFDVSAASFSFGALASLIFVVDFVILSFIHNIWSNLQNFKPFENVKDMQETLICSICTLHAGFLYSLHVISADVRKNCAFNILLEKVEELTLMLVLVDCSSCSKVFTKEKYWIVNNHYFSEISGLSKTFWLKCCLSS